MTFLIFFFFGQKKVLCQNTFRFLFHKSFLANHLNVMKEKMGTQGEKKVGGDERMRSLRMQEGFRTQIGELILE